MIIGSKNKGNWSEFYALLYIIGKRVLYCADKDLNRLESYFFPVNRVIRKESADKVVEYILKNKDAVEIYVGHSFKKVMTSNEFRREAQLLYEDLKNTSGSSFDISHEESFLNDIELDQLGMPNTEVSDINLDLHDINTGIDQVMGFSIKSYIGNAPTLLNASGSTNFIYEIDGMNDSEMETINSIETRTKIQDRLLSIMNLGCKLKYHGMNSKVFEENLMMIDTMMPKIISYIILDSYISNETDCKELVKNIEIDNPLHYPRDGLYMHKYKSFLLAKALGMNPDKRWDGVDNANGGYIVVKENGDVLAYHLYNRNELQQYLLDNTFLERASTSRHKYATIYKEGDQFFINLNLQIRFK